MNFKSIKLWALSAVTSCAFMSVVHAENIEVTPVQQVTQHELAAIYVLSEICPAIVKDQDKFNAGYSKLVAEYLPNQQDPVKTLDQLSKQSSFKPILDEAQADAKQAGDAKNQMICSELTAYTNS